MNNCSTHFVFEVVFSEGYGYERHLLDLRTFRDTYPKNVARPILSTFRDLTLSGRPYVAASRSLPWDGSAIPR